MDAPRVARKSCLDGVTLLVGGAVDLTASNATTCNNGGEGTRMVVATGVHVDVGSATKLGSKRYHCIFQKASLVEVVE